MDLRLQHTPHRAPDEGREVPQSCAFKVFPTLRLSLIQRSVTRERSERPKLRQWIETLDAIVDQLGPVQDDLKLVPRELLEDLAVGLPLTADVDGDRDGIAVAPAVESLEPQPVLAEQQSVLAEQSVPSSESLTASPDERPVQRQQEAPSPSR
mmetsp:Transcript_32898/g.77148  ORF Transcript_32898/g.77148 Transcript_32898/m.77148 type:complete len:153 (+) Transcript_32898:262-720(+)